MKRKSTQSLGSVAFRVDQGDEIGSGHLSRCRALADYFRDQNIKTHFLCCTIDPDHRDKLRSHGHELLLLEPSRGTAEDAARSRDILRAEDPNVIVLDGYHFDPQFMDVVTDSGKASYFSVAIDDFAEKHRFPVDLIVNQNPLCSPKDYDDKTDDSTRYLFGTEYSLVRPELSSRRNAYSPPTNIRNVLVTLGTAASPKFYETIAGFLNQLDTNPKDLTLVLGRDNSQNLDRISPKKKNLDNVKILKFVDNFDELLIRSDLVVAAAGGTTLRELAFLGIPSLTVRTSSNQRVGPWFADKGYSLFMGDMNSLDQETFGQYWKKLFDSPEKREAMYRRGRSLIDGDGPARIHKFLHQYLNPME